jgi:hypothetical protein
MLDDLNDDNFLIYAMKAYSSPNCILSEFESDLKRIKYLKRLFRRYKLTKNLKERLILNHIILLSNVFGPDATTRILFFKIGSEDYDVLKTFLLYLNLCPKTVKNIKGQNISTSEIPVDMHIADILRKL